jgi:hypothetical protein
MNLELQLRQKKSAFEAKLDKLNDAIDITLFLPSV